MAIFRYQGFLSNGKKVKGHIHADDLLNAKNKLLQREFLLTKIRELNGKEKISSLSKEDSLLFTKELAKLLNAGLPLFEALLALEEKYRGQKCHPILVDFCDNVKQGASFSSILKKHPFSFDPLYLSMVENSEKTGSLEKTLEELAKLLSRSLSIKKQLFSALLYPMILGIFCLVVLGTLFFYVVPSLSELFEGRKLHPVTAFILSFSKILNSHKISLVFSGSVSAFLLIFSFYYSKSKEFILKIALRIPFIGKLFCKLSLVRFCRSASSLLSSGLPFLDALRLARKVIRHPFLEEIFEKAERGLLSGEKVSEILQTSPFIPPLFTRMLALAEVGGNLSLMLQHLAEIYEEDLEKQFARITQMAQPVLLLFLGLVVGLVLLSVLLPLTDVGSFLEKTY